MCAKAAVPCSHGHFVCVIRSWCDPQKQRLTSLFCGPYYPLQVTSDGTVYVGHQDMTVKKFLPLDSAVNGGAADSQPTTPRRANGAAAVQVRFNRTFCPRPVRGFAVGVLHSIPLWPLLVLSLSIASPCMCWCCGLRFHKLDCSHVPPRWPPFLLSENVCEAIITCVWLLVSVSLLVDPTGPSTPA